MAHDQPTVRIEDLQPDDWPAVRAIYAEGIASGDATFETAPPDWPTWDAGHLTRPRLVARRDGDVVGWAALSPVTERCAYAGVAEVSVYVASTARGQGVGRRLLGALAAQAERSGIWTLQAGVFPENAASLALHRACGFRTVGVRERLGRLDGRWRDVVLLERRRAHDPPD
jgi:L-amino acid N-acyltransferase YncA